MDLEIKQTQMESPSREQSIHLQSPSLSVINLPKKLKTILINSCGFTSHGFNLNRKPAGGMRWIFCVCVCTACLLQIRDARVPGCATLQTAPPAGSFGSWKTKCHVKAMDLTQREIRKKASSTNPDELIQRWAVSHRHQISHGNQPGIICYWLRACNSGSMCLHFNVDINNLWVRIWTVRRLVWACCHRC